MVKTRLDEIVEKELEGILSMGELRQACHRIADASFRHGVERRDKHAYFSVCNHDDVQPAPAGTHPWKLDFDRRKGQRRKGTEVYSTVYELEDSRYKSIFQTLPNCPWYFNRRSGSDRRKS